MGFRFQKRINLGGGLRLNLSKRGVGVSSGVKGFRVGIGPRGTRTTASIPGTGMSWVSQSSGKPKQSKQPKQSVENYEYTRADKRLFCWTCWRTTDHSEIGSKSQVATGVAGMTAAAALGAAGIFIWPLSVPLMIAAGVVAVGSVAAGAQKERTYCCQRCGAQKKKTE